MKFLSKTIVHRLGWSTGSYAVGQVLRLGNNVVLARLLAPELFGLMVIVNTVRTGIELTSDIGIGQNIVSNKNAEDATFYDTAWTLQVLRGLGLAGLCAIAAYPISLFYHDRTLFSVFLVASLFFVFAGFESTGRFLAQRRLHLRSLGFFEIGVAAISVTAHIGFALISPTIWALVFGGITSSAGVMVLSYLLIPGIRHRFRLVRSSMIQILSFGRWVFLSTIIYFLSMNFDRLYMSGAVSLAILGTYGIARSLADILNLLVARVGNFIIFPMVAASYDSISVLRERIARRRPGLLAMAAVGVGFFIAISDRLVTILYDARYSGAAAMLPTLSAGVWFAIMSTMNESVLLGIGKPSYGAIANAIKFTWLVVALPVAVKFFGIAGATCAIAVAEVIRYVPLWVAQKRVGLAFGRQDATLTLVMIAALLCWRSLFWLLGLTGSIAALLPIVVK